MQIASLRAFRPVAVRGHFTLALLASAGALACGSQPSSSNATTGAPSNAGRAVVLLSQVPFSVSCVEIDVAGARAVTERFDVTGGESAVLSLTGLPLGQVTFTGLAYPLACAGVTSTVQATWISAPTPATLSSGAVANVSLTMVPNGQASVSVGFQPDDAGTDGAADAADGGGPDAAPPVGFNNPVSIAIPFNASTIVTSSPALSPLTLIDGDHDFPTQSVAQSLSAVGVGFPSNALFPASGTASPTVQLGWSDPTTPLNTLVVSTAAATTFQIAVPAGQYERLQLYAMDSNGPSTLDYTLDYASGPATSFTASIPDWCVPGAFLTPGDSILASADRSINSTAIDTSIACNIYAINLNPDPTRTLVGFTFEAVGTGVGSNFVLYGATAW